MTWCIGEAALWAMILMAAFALLLALAAGAGRLWLADRARRARQAPPPVTDNGSRLAERRASARRRGVRRRHG